MLPEVLLILEEAHRPPGAGHLCTKRIEKTVVPLAFLFARGEQRRGCGPQLLLGRAQRFRGEDGERRERMRSPLVECAVESSLRKTATSAFLRRTSWTARR